MDVLHLNLNRAITTPWSGTLLFAGSFLIGLGFATGCVGDAAMLVSVLPDAWESFDIVADCIAALLAVTGMALVQAATSTKRTVSLAVSAVLVGTGLGIGIVTL